MAKVLSITLLPSFSYSSPFLLFSPPSSNCFSTHSVNLLSFPRCSRNKVVIVLGPSVIGRDNVIVEKVFPRTSFYVSETFAFFGCMLFMFLVGVKIDLNSVKHSGKKGLAIGLCCFFLPLLLNTSVAVLLQRALKMDPVLQKSIISIAVFQASSSFYVTTCLLTDLKLLNSELGHLAVSASMISGMLSWCGLILAFIVEAKLIWREQSSAIYGFKLVLRGESSSIPHEADNALHG